MPTRACLIVALFSFACGESNTNTTPDAGIDASTNDASRDAGDAELPQADAGPVPNELTAPEVAEICVPSTDWTHETPAFVDSTGKSNFESLGAGIEGHPDGIALTVTDFDGDGLADLYAYSVGRDSLAEGGVRKSWLLKNVGDLAFEDVTFSSGIVERRYPIEAEEGRAVGVAAWADVDNDGDMDVFVAARTIGLAAEEAQELLLNQGDGTFALAPLDKIADLHAFGDELYPHGATFFDANRDGRVDLFLALNRDTATRGAMVDRLLLQQDDGSFVNATEAAGLLTMRPDFLEPLNAGEAHARSWASLACDLNNDGNQELLVSSYGRSPNLLWQGQLSSEGVATYTNRSVASGYAFDDRTDWTVDNSARCYCALVPDAEECEGVPPPASNFSCDPDRLEGDLYFRWVHSRHRNVGYLGGNSGTTVCADFNGDGWMDLLTNEIVHWDVGEVSDPSEILLNSQDPTIVFERPGNENTGLVREQTTTAWNDGDLASAALDFDNDGRIDILLGSGSYAHTRAHLFHQKEDGTFGLVPIAAGIDMLSNVGVGTADYDRDGDIDLVLGHSVTRCDQPGPTSCYEQTHLRLFENVVGAKNNWVQVRLVGGESTNRAAIGARVTVHTDASELVQVQDVDGGHGRRGMQHDQVLHFGLGEACEADITVRWPDKTLSRDHVRLKANHRYVIRQGQSVALDSL